MIYALALLFSLPLCATDTHDSVLHDAVLEKNYESIEQLVGKMDVNCCNDNQQTALHYAAHIGDIYMTKMLCDAHAMVDALDIENSTPMHYAARSNSLAVAQLLHECGADINKKNIYGASPLYIAVFSGSYELAEWLISLGADVHERDVYGATLALCAAEMGHSDIIPLLCKHGATLNDQDENGDTPLHAAVYNERCKSLATLIFLEADPMIRNNQGMTPAELADSLGFADIAESLKRYESHYQEQAAREMGGAIEAINASI